MRPAPFIPLILLMGLGCHTPAKPLAVPMPPMPTSAVPPELPAVKITPFEPDYKTLPSLDAKSVTASERKPPRGIEVASVIAFAASHSTTASLLEKENELPTVNAGTELLKELRAFVASEARNRAVGEALGSFYQLADADGRADLLRQSLQRLSDLRAAAEKAKAEGARVPVEPEELDQQKVQSLGILGQADLGANLLEIDLLRRLGLPGKAGERLRPTGKFDLEWPPQPQDEAIKQALETRADLQALRLLYLKLNTENLPAIREYLRGTTAGAGLVGPMIPAIPGAKFLVQRQQAKAEAKAAPALAVEVEVRRRQLFVMIEEKERITADEVRASLLAVEEQYRQVGLARGRTEQLITKLADLKRQTKGPFLEVPAEVEVLRARAEVLAAVMGWHQARVKLLTAQGAYSGK
jgi:hypothetical protein